LFPKTAVFRSPGSGFRSPIHWFSIAYPLVSDPLSIDGAIENQWIGDRKPLDEKSKGRIRENRKS